MFVFDDHANIVSNLPLAIHDFNLNALKQAAFSSASGPLLRPISMISFAANHYATGLNPFYFKFTNLIIHLLNGVGVFILTGALLNFYRKRFEPGFSVAHAQWISLAVASAWLLHPLNLTSVLYVVQRMTSLSAFFSIWGLAIFLWGRIRLYEGKKGILTVLASILIFTPLAAFSKESGALLPLLMLVAEMTLFTFHTEKLSARRFLIGLYTISAAIPIVVALAYIVTHPDWLLAGYANRGFTLIERLMTEARVLWFYMQQIVLPNTAQMGLYLDDISVSRGLLQPVSTLFASAWLILIGWSAVFFRKKAPLAAFGIGFFLIGHVFESTIYPLDIAYEHRNYLPMYGIVLVIFFYLLHPLFHVKSLQLRRSASLVLILMFAFGTFSRANAWANPYDFAQAEFKHHPNSVRANIELAYVYDSFIPATPEGKEEYYLLARQRYEHAAQLDRNDISGLSGLIISSARRGKSVEVTWIKELSFRLEYAPYAAVASDKLLDLTTCHLKDECRLPSAWVGNLLDSALRNRTVSGRDRAKLFYAKSFYLINIMHDYPAATVAMHKMVESAPGEPSSRFVLIDFLTAMRYFDKADAEIKKARVLHMSETDTNKLAQLEQQLADTMGKPATTIK